MKKVLRWLGALVLAAAVCFAGAALADSWNQGEDGYWRLVDDSGNPVTDFSSMSSVTIPAKVDKLDAQDFYSIENGFIIYCEPGSCAEKFALKYGLQYDNGVERVVGTEIKSTEEKARWIVDHYTTPDMTVEEKALHLHRWLLWNAEYDYTYRNHSAAGVLVEGKGVCESYAKAMQMMLTMAGVPNKYVSGSANNNTGNGFEGHAWNLIQVNGKWYHVDTTWGLFMLTDEEIGYDHHWSVSTNSTGFVQRGSQVRYYDENGAMLTGLQWITRTDYTYDMSTYPKDNWHYETTRKLYYFGEDGVMRTGFQTVDGKHYYFKLEGDAVTEDLRHEEDGTYYFGKDGAAQTGLLWLSDNYNPLMYFGADGKRVQEGWIEDGGNRYHASNGTLDTGRTKIGDDYYYFDQHGRMKTGMINLHYYGEDGKQLFGWQVIKGHTYYFYPGEGDAMRAGIHEVDGVKYGFDRSGKLLTGLQSLDGELYFFGEDGAQLTGWQTSNGRRYYFRDSAWAGFIYPNEDSNSTYYCDPVTREMYTGLLVLNDGSYQNGKSLYFGADGKMFEKAWIELDGKRMYAGFGGYLLCSGRTTVDGDSYCFGDDCVMQTGLVLLDGELYCFGEDGKQLYGKQDINGATYCFSGPFGSAVRGMTYDGAEYGADGKMLGQDPLPSAAHIHVLEEIPGKEPSCTEKGWTAGYRCTECGEVVSPGKELPEKHSPVKDDKVYPTRTKPGLTAGTHCSICGKVLQAQEPIPMTSLTGSFVERCYNLILGRNPDQDGLDDWTFKLEYGTRTAAEIIQGFLLSPEYTTRRNSPEETVEILYRTMLDRASDEGGKNTWTSILNNGCSQDSVINGFTNSQEFSALCEEYGLLGGKIESLQARDTNPSVTAFVNRCYTEVLNRAGEEGGLNNWCEAILSRTQTPKNVAAGFVFSQELQNRNLSTEETVDMLYRLYLGREADPDGKAYWLQQMAEGMTLEQLNDGFADSAEFAGIVAGYGL